MDRDRLRISPSARASLSADGLVLLDIDGGLVLASNAIGAHIWQLIAQGRSCGEIARRLVEDYEVPPDRARHDLDAFVDALLARGLLSAEPPC